MSVCCGSSPQRTEARCIVLRLRRLCVFVCRRAHTGQARIHAPFFCASGDLARYQVYTYNVNHAEGEVREAGVPRMEFRTRACILCTSTRFELIL